MLVNFAVPSLRLIFSSIFFTTALFLLWGINDRPSSPQSLQSLPKSGKNYAYTTFLAAPWNVNENATDDDDNYYTQTRMLNWQLRHDPPTRSPNNYPFVVLVTSEVSQSKRARMEREGMIVKEVKKLKLQHPTRKAWQDVLTKLRLFEMVEYDRLLFLDIDHVIARPMDDIFEAVEPLKNKQLNTVNATQPDEGPQPSTYLFASNAGSGGFNHTIPPYKGNNLNAGILLLQPSIELFNYYLSLISPEAETRYNGRYPEQGLWGYAHRRDGNMPWKQLHWKWNINWAMYTDFEAGVKSLHTKYWELDHDLRLRDLAYSIKWKMEGFWEARDAIEGY